MEKTYKFTLPQNKEVENTKIRIENGQVVVDVEFKEKFEPKDGDFVVDVYNDVFILNSELNTSFAGGCYVGYNTKQKEWVFNIWNHRRMSRYATAEEKSDFLARLEKECGKKWNAEKKCLEDVYVPKFGDIVKVICGDKNSKRDYMICIVPEHDYDVYNIANINKGGVLSYVCGKNSILEIKPATESEKQELFDKLAEVGKRWNPETKQLEDIRWRAKRRERYYFVTSACDVATYEESNIGCDDIYYNLGNYFRNVVAAQKVADQIKEIFKNSKAE